MGLATPNVHQEEEYSHQKCMLLNEEASIISKLGYYRYRSALFSHSKVSRIISDAVDNDNEKLHRKYCTVLYSVLYTYGTVSTTTAKRMNERINYFTIEAKKVVIGTVLID